MSTSPRSVRASPVASDPSSGTSVVESIEGGPTTSIWS